LIYIYKGEPGFKQNGNLSQEKINA
jgi:hypothetical protein